MFTFFAPPIKRRKEEEIKKEIKEIVKSIFSYGHIFDGGMRRVHKHDSWIPRTSIYIQTGLQSGLTAGASAKQVDVWVIFNHQPSFFCQFSSSSAKWTTSTNFHSGPNSLRHLLNNHTMPRWTPLRPLRTSCDQICKFVCSETFLFPFNPQFVFYLSGLKVVISAT